MNGVVLPAVIIRQIAQVHLDRCTILSNPIKKPDGPGSFAVDAHSMLMLKAWHKMALVQFRLIPPKLMMRKGSHLIELISAHQNVSSFS